MSGDQGLVVVDVLDAAVLALTAQAIERGTAFRLKAGPPRAARGLRMAILE